MAEGEKPQLKTEEELRIALQALAKYRDTIEHRISGGVGGILKSNVMRNPRHRDEIYRFGVEQVMLGIRYALGEVADTDKVGGIFDILTLVGAYRSSQKLRGIRETLVPGGSIVADKFNKFLREEEGENIKWQKY